MKNIYVGIVSSLFFVASSLAANPVLINDPHNFLGQVDQFLGTVPFDEAFKITDQIEFQNSACQKTCTLKQCTVSCTQTPGTGTVASLTTSEVKIKGSPFKSTHFKVTQADYNAANGNLIKMIFQNPGIMLVPDSVAIEAVRTGKYTFADGTQAPSMSIDYTLNYSGGKAGLGGMVPFTATIVQGVPAMAQVAEIQLRTPEINPEPLAKVLSFKR